MTERATHGWHIGTPEDTLHVPPERLRAIAPLEGGLVAYKVGDPPEQKRETVTLYANPNVPVQWVLEQCDRDTHSITFDLIDGKPDPDSIRMEPLG